MAITHASPGTVIDVRPLQESFANAETWALVKTDALEVLRLVMPAGKKIAEHKAPLEITVQCLEGKVLFTSQGQTRKLTNTVVQGPRMPRSPTVVSATNARDHTTSGPLDGASGD